ncbi:MAG TPA: hypothetical protein G4N93_05700 [Dehalococcoidia bacterium]|nr:hypothetical protein [Dehalococcoidia bacterium]
MIKGFNDITSESPIEQIWKLLRFFRDTPSVSDKIRSIHGIQKGKFDADVKKQAQQIGYCIRQAEEYFHASSQVGLPTRPLLLYYGAVSLSQALVLLREHGTHSLDALRKEKKHNHHGLDLERRLMETARPDAGTENFLELIQCKCHIKNGIPWGQFALFYQNLVPCAFGIEIEIHDEGKSMFLHSDVPQNCADLLPLNSIVSKYLNVLDLVKSLPDIYFTLQQLGIQPDLCRGSVKGTVIRYYKKDEQGNEQVEKTKADCNFFIDGITTEQKEHLLTFYEERNPNITLQADLGLNIHLRLTEEATPPDQVHERYFPDILDDINSRKFYILKPEFYTPEPAAYFVLLYCLGMLARYYPDTWMRAIDENVQIAELTDSLLNIIYRKFPNLILDQMTWVKHYVHL